MKKKKIERFERLTGIIEADDRQVEFFTLSEAGWTIVSANCPIDTSKDVLTVDPSKVIIIAERPLR